MGGPAAKNDPLNRSSTLSTGLACAAVHAMFELKETSHTVGIDIVADRRSSELDGLLQHTLQGYVKTLQLRARKSSGVALWPNAGAEQALIRINVAQPHAGATGSATRT